MRPQLQHPLDVLEVQRKRILRSHVTFTRFVLQDERRHRTSRRDRSGTRVCERSCCV